MCEGNNLCWVMPDDITPMQQEELEAHIAKLIEEQSDGPVAQG